MGSMQEVVPLLLCSSCTVRFDTDRAHTQCGVRKMFQEARVDSEIPSARLLNGVEVCHRYAADKRLMQGVCSMHLI